MGKIITFYSYKGGVGRTMALANVAALLAKWGKKVLVIDWDLEAPGIEHFFSKDSDSAYQSSGGNDLTSLENRVGLIEILTKLSTSPSKAVSDDDWLPHVIQVFVRNIKNPIHMLTAGARTQGYFGNVRKLDVKDFYEAKNGGYIIEGLRNGWKTHFDFILIDSRTGITDIGGICTIQLPDILAIVFTATSQSLSGAIQVAEKAATRRQDLPFDRSLVPVVPIPSRFDMQTEHEVSKDWLERFEKELSPLYDPWLPKNTNRRDFLSLTKIPYTAYFSFGERLAVIEQGTVERTGLGHAYETVAALLANNLEYADLLLGNRDEFVKLARTNGRLPKVPLREFSWDTLLFIDLVGANTLQAAFEAADNTEGHTAFESYQSLINRAARQNSGELAQSDGLSFLFAFLEPEQALACALAIQEAIQIKSPITGPLGSFRVRIALHADSKRKSEEKKSQSDMVQAVSRIGSKAGEGEILISAPARERISEGVQHLKFVEKFRLEIPTEVALDALLTIYEAILSVPVDLTPAERDALFDQDPGSKSGGGFQALLVALQNKVEDGNHLELSISDRERIARYAHDYRGGGWQGKLRKIFGRTLGSNLGRELSKG